MFFFSALKLVHKAGKFLYHSFSDSRGMPDGSRVSQFVCIALVIQMVQFYLFKNKNIDIAAFIALLTVAATGQIASTLDTRGKNQAEAAVAIARARAAAGIPEASTTNEVAVEGDLNVKTPTIE